MRSCPFDLSPAIYWTGNPIVVSGTPALARNETFFVLKANRAKAMLLLFLGHLTMWDEGYNLPKCIEPEVPIQRVWREEMPSSKPTLTSVTPDSVKALMVIEAIVIAFLSFWLTNEYVYNAYFRIYIDSVFVQHLTSYTVAIGLGMGLAGTAVAAALYKTMRDAKVKLESVAPKIRGSVEKLLTSVAIIDTKSPSASTSPVAIVTQAEANPATAANGTAVSPPKASEEKK